MPPTVADLFRPLHNILLEIHLKWSQFRQLFGTDPERIALLNRFAPLFFGSAQVILYDDVVLSLFRYADPEATGGKKNLTLARLASAVMAADASFGASVRDDAEAIRTLLSPHADWRNKRVAHNDLTTATARWDGNSILSGPSREQIEEILSRMRLLMNGVAVHFGEAPTAYEGMMTPNPGDAYTLVRYLEDLARRQDADRAAGRGPWTPG
jgi:hypothetical protein